LTTKTSSSPFEVLSVATGASADGDADYRDADPDGNPVCKLGSHASRTRDHAGRADRRDDSAARVR
jgi:hypothetical protein